VQAPAQQFNDDNAAGRTCDNICVLSVCTFYCFDIAVAGSQFNKLHQSFAGDLKMTEYSLVAAENGLQRRGLVLDTYNNQARITIETSSFT
jgi:hypothetical protein